MLQQIKPKLLSALFINDLSTDLLPRPHCLWSSLEHRLTLSVMIFLDFTNQKVSNHSSNPSLKQISSIDFHKPSHAQAPLISVERLFLLLPSKSTLFLLLLVTLLQLIVILLGLLTEEKFFDKYEVQVLQIRILLKKHLLSKTKSLDYIKNQICYKCGEGREEETYTATLLSSIFTSTPGIWKTGEVKSSLFWTDKEIHRLDICASR